MVKKTTKKTTRKNNKTTKKKVVKKVDQEVGSLTIMLLAIFGIILLIYFGTSSDIEPKMNLKENTEEEIILDKEIIISGKKYESEERAYKILHRTPQTNLTDAEINFVESYK
jgi:hypothetical protein